MGNYSVVRVWQLKPGSSGSQLELLMSSGLLEVQRWIPGMKRISLVRLGGEQAERYLLIATFSSFEAYTYWRQVEVEGPDYWERFALVLSQWERLSQLVEEYAGEVVVDARLDDSVQG